MAEGSPSRTPSTDASAAWPARAGGNATDVSVGGRWKRFGPVPGSRGEAGASASSAIPCSRCGRSGCRGRVPGGSGPGDPDARPPFPAIAFPAERTDPPIELPEESMIATPLPAFEGSLARSPPPMTFPSMMWDPPPSIRMPSPLNPRIASSRIVLEPVRRSSPCAGWLNWLPSSSTIGMASLPSGTTSAVVSSRETAVDHNRVRDRGESRQQGDRVRSGTRELEQDDIGAILVSGCVGLDDRLGE